MSLLAMIFGDRVCYQQRARMVQREVSLDTEQRAHGGCCAWSVGRSCSALSESFFSCFLQASFWNLSLTSWGLDECSLVENQVRLNQFWSIYSPSRIGDIFGKLKEVWTFWGMLTLIESIVKFIANLSTTKDSLAVKVNISERVRAGLLLPESYPLAGWGQRVCLKSMNTKNYPFLFIMLVTYFPLAFLKLNCSHLHHVFCYKTNSKAGNWEAWFGTKLDNSNFVLSWSCPAEFLRV